MPTERIHLNDPCRHEGDAVMSPSLSLLRKDLAWVECPLGQVGASSLSFSKSLGDKHHAIMRHYPSTIDEETEGQRGQITCPVCLDLGSGKPYPQAWAVSGGHGFSASWGEGTRY